MGIFCLRFSVRMTFGEVEMKVFRLIWLLFASGFEIDYCDIDSLSFGL